MLVITRKVGERLIIGHDIEVTVLKIRGNRVKLGIRASADLPIHREELQARPIHRHSGYAFEVEIISRSDEFMGTWHSAKDK